VAVTDGGNTQACLWRNGQPILLGIPAGGDFSVALGINNKSEICGYWGNSVTGPHRAFIWRDGVMTDLKLPLDPHSVAEDINDASQITGWMGNIQSSHCFVWSGGTVTDLGPIAGGVSGRGSAIGRNGMVSGWGLAEPTRGGPSQARSAQWRGGQTIDLGMLPKGEHMRVHGGNDFATVGYCDRPSSIGDRGFLFQGGTLHDLSDLAANAVIGSAKGINQYGQIVARGWVDGGPTATILLTPKSNNPADVSHDCRVDVDDVIAVIVEWGNDSYADADGNGVVDVDDLILVILNWTH
jgi:uncharacterized membrane protein